MSKIPSPWKAIRRADCITIESADGKAIALLVWHEHSEAAELLEAAQLMAQAREMRDALQKLTDAFDAPHRVDLGQAVIQARSILAQVTGGAK